MRVRATTLGTPLPCSQNIGGAQMTAMNTATKKGTTMELAAFIPATTMIKLARITIEGILKGGFTGLFNLYHSHRYRADKFSKMVAPFSLNA
jgi:hypothetical protein